MKRDYLSQFTSIRKNYFSKASILLILSTAFAAIGVFLVSRGWSIVGWIVAGVATLSVMSSAVYLILLVTSQVSWKDFWGTKLFEVMSAANQAGDHDLFNRAMILRGFIESQPDVPVPGSFKFYAAIYAGAQALLLVFFR